MRRVPVLVLATLWLLAGVASLPAADSPYTGNWKVMIHLTSGVEIPAWLVQVAEKDGKPEVSILSAGQPNLRSATVENVKLTDRTIRFDLKLPIATFAVTAYRGEKDDAPKVLRGSVVAGPQTYYGELAKTEDATIDASAGPGGQAVAQAYQQASRDKTPKGLEQFIEQNKDKPISNAARLVLVGRLAKTATPAEVRKLGDQAVEFAGTYGPVMRQYTLLRLARTLGADAHSAPLAVAYAHQAEKSLDKDAQPSEVITTLNALATALGKVGSKDELKEVEKRVAALEVSEARKAEEKLPANAPSAQVLPVLRSLAKALKRAGEQDDAKKTEARITELELKAARDQVARFTESTPGAIKESAWRSLATALRKAGQNDEAKELETKLATLEKELDDEFSKTAIPFEPKAFEARKEPSDRVVVLELFTGAQCPPCVAADTAFDALLKTYKPSEVVLIQYHLHIPGPDPLTNADSEARADYYGTRATPTLYLNGQEGPPTGGAKSGAQRSYDALVAKLNPLLDVKPQAKLKLAAHRTGDKIAINAEVSDVKMTEGDLRLRLVLLEDVVRYAGGNRQRLHHHVVRGFPGGVEGFAVKEKELKKELSVAVPDVQKTLQNYLDDAGQRMPFRDSARPLELKDLKLVAFVQDDATKQILNAIQVDLDAK